MERYNAKSTMRRMSNGICSAIIAVNLNQEPRHSQFDEYDFGAKSTLDDFSDSNSDIYRAFPHLREILKDDVANAKNMYPNREALPYLIKILNIVSLSSW